MIEVGEGWPRQPVLYEINTWVWLDELSRAAGRRLSLATVPGEEIERLAGLGNRGGRGDTTEGCEGEGGPKRLHVRKVRCRSRASDGPRNFPEKPVFRAAREILPRRALSMR